MHGADATQDGADGADRIDGAERWRRWRRWRRTGADREAGANQGPINLRGLAETQTRLTLQLSPRVMQALASLIAQGPDLSSEANEVWESMEAWDGRFAPDRRGAALYHVFASHLTRLLLEEKIPSDLVDRYLSLAWVEPRVFVEGALIEAAAKGRPGGWSDPALLVPLLGRSLHQAWVSLSYIRGPNREQWNWGGLHSLSFRPFVSFDAFAPSAIWSYGGDRAYPGQGGGVGMAQRGGVRR